MKYKTFSEMNELLRTAANINPKSCNGKKIEDIAATIGISSQMLYKYVRRKSRLSTKIF